MVQREVLDMSNSNTRRAASAAGTVAPVTFAGVQDIGNQSMVCALRGRAFAEAALQVWPALGKDFAKGDDANWALFEAGAVAAYDRNNPAPYAIRGEDGSYTLADKGSKDDTQLTANYLRTMAGAEWRNLKDNAPTLYQLCRARKDDTVDPAIRSAKRNLKVKIDAFLSKGTETRRANRTFLEAIRKLAEEQLKKCTNELAKGSEGTDRSKVISIRVEVQNLLKSL